MLLEPHVTTVSSSGSSSEAHDAPVRKPHVVEQGRVKPAPGPTPALKHVAPAAPAKQRWILSLLLIAALGGGGYFAYPRAMAYLATVNTPPPPPPVRVVPVVTTTVERGDMNIYLNGLGTVTAFKTVTVRSRIEGEVIKVNFTEGQMVQEGDLLAEIDPRTYQMQLKEAQAQLRKDEAALRLADADLERYLSASKAVTRQQVDTQRALVQQNEAAIEQAKGEIGHINLQLRYCRITAPISGRIGLRHVDAGNIVAANDPVGFAVITQLQPIAVVFPLPQDDISGVQKRMTAGQELKVDVFDRDFQNCLASGTLAALDNQVDVQSGTVRLKAVFPNEDNMLFPNQFVNARLLLETLHDVVQVPAAAVQHGPNFAFVYLVTPDSTVALRTVELGPTVGELTAIEKGVSPGDSVVIDGLDKLQDGAKVAVRGQNSASDSRSPTGGERTPAKGH